MTSKKDWFDTYKPYNDGMVQMGNDATCSVIGIGTVKIKMFDGVVRVLSNVRHVRTYVIHLLGTYVTILCNWLIF